MGEILLSATTSTSFARPILELRDVRKHYQLGWQFGPLGKSRVVRAVDGVSLRVDRGRTLSLVGESGSGKTTTAKLVLGLERPTGGEILVEGKPPGSRSNRGRVQAVFQDPASSLDPRMTVSAIIEEPLQAIHARPRSARRDRVRLLLDRVGLDQSAPGKYPHEFSGGQRQRIAIARAMASEPRLIVLDEPVSSLDVSIRAQIINLLAQLQQDMGTSYLMISHDLASVRAMSDDIAVMYAGRIVERAPAEGIFTNPGHPYTRALLAAAYLRDDDAATPVEVNGFGVSQTPLEGCSFRARCPLALTRCAAEDPALRPVDEHEIACHLYPDTSESSPSRQELL